MNDFCVLGVIPARGGSRRLPGKNILPLAGKPLIQYTLEAAFASKMLSECIVSTDSKEISTLTRRLGGNVPFIRPSELAGDEVPDRPVLHHAVEWYRDQHRQNPDAVLLLRPTTPFKTGQMIDDAIQLLITEGADSVRSMTSVEGVHHPFWMFRKEENSRTSPLLPDYSMETYYQSQLLPPVYRLNGVVDIMKTQFILNPDLPLYGFDMRMLEIGPEVSVDIDTEWDLRHCEWILSNKIEPNSH